MCEWIVECFKGGWMKAWNACHAWMFEFTSWHSNPVIWQLFHFVCCLLEKESPLSPRKYCQGTLCAYVTRIPQCQSRHKSGFIWLKTGMCSYDLILNDEQGLIRLLYCNLNQVSNEVKRLSLQHYVSAVVHFIYRTGADMHWNLILLSFWCF